MFDIFSMPFVSYRIHLSISFWVALLTVWRSFDGQGTCVVTQEDAGKHWIAPNHENTVKRDNVSRAWEDVLCYKYLLKYGHLEYINKRTWRGLVPTGICDRPWYISWQLSMMTSSNGNIFRVTGPLWGESTGHPCVVLLAQASNAEIWCFFDPRLNKRLSKQWRRRWFETPSPLLWRHC